VNDEADLTYDHIPHSESAIQEEQRLQLVRSWLETLQRPKDIYAARCKAALQFEKDHTVTIKDFHFKKGALVLIRNTKIEKSLNQKMRPRYLGPVIVVARNRG
ncbi:hypothetical protein C0991_010531, partial [Blastosporella zonata]